MVRLSFIVPFYNVEPYIEECIRSLYNQDISQEEYEVICIDDCSPDGSRSVVERLQKEYPTLKLLQTPKNLRQGGARNMGLDAAQGKYVWFVDSDDYIKPNCLAKLLLQADNENLDILDFDFEADLSKQLFTKNIYPFDLGPCSGADYVFCTQYGGRWSWRCSCVWGGVIRYDLIKNMRFREHVQYEDNDFALLMYARAKRVHHVPNKPYFYRVVEGSTVHNKPTLLYVGYNIDLLNAFVGILEGEEIKGEVWIQGVKELIKWTAYKILMQLKGLSIDELNVYFSSKNKIRFAYKYLGKKVKLALSNKLIFQMLYK